MFHNPIISVSELIYALLGDLPSASAGLSLLDSFSENVGKIKSHQWVSFWIKPLVLGRQKSLSRETYSELQHHKHGLENEAPTFFLLQERKVTVSDMTQVTIYATNSLTRDELLSLVWFVEPLL